MDTAPPPADPRSQRPCSPLRAQSVCAAHALTGGPVDGGPSVAVLVCAFPLTCASIGSISTGSSMQAMTGRDALMPRAHGCAGAATFTAGKLEAITQYGSWPVKSHVEIDDERDRELQARMKSLEGVGSTWVMALALSESEKDNLDRG